MDWVEKALRSRYGDERFEKIKEEIEMNKNPYSEEKSTYETIEESEGSPEEEEFANELVIEMSHGQFDTPSYYHVEIRVEDIPTKEQAELLKDIVEYLCTPTPLMDGLCSFDVDRNAYAILRERTPLDALRRDNLEACKKEHPSTPTTTTKES